MISRLRCSISTAAVLAAFTLSAEAVRAAEPSIAAHATVDESRQFDFVSAVNGRSYRVRVALPEAQAPPGGFPVLYVTDGQAFFGSFTDLMRVRTLGGEVSPAVIVGIGYPEENVMTAMRRRSLDLTPSPIDAAEETRRAATNAAMGGPPPEYNGADNFFKVIETEIKPRIAAITRVDPKRSALYGHSLGGLFTLHVLFTHPEAYRTYLVSSPSIWWNNRNVLKDEAAFSAKVSAGAIDARVFFVVGGDEQTPPKPPFPPGMTEADARKATANAAMVDNMRAVAARLAALRGAPGYEVRSRVFPAETHLSVPFASLNTLAAFALPPAPPR